MKLPLFLTHGPAMKSMAMLGDLAFGPPCDECGRPMTRYMLPAHREIVKRLNDGKAPEELGGACHCKAVAA